MAELAVAKIIRYRETAVALRRHAGRLRPDQATVIKQLLALADGWEQLADSVQKERLP